MSLLAVAPEANDSSASLFFPDPEDGGSLYLQKFNNTSHIHTAKPQEYALFFVTLTKLPIIKDNKGETVPVLN
jgi:hypothetical protein